MNSSNVDRAFYVMLLTLAATQFSARVLGQPTSTRSSLPLQVSRNDLTRAQTSFDSSDLAHTTLGQLILSKPAQVRVLDGGSKWEMKPTPDSDWNATSGSLTKKDYADLIAALDKPAVPEIRFEGGTKNVANVHDLEAAIGKKLLPWPASKEERGRQVNQAKIGADLRTMGINGTVSPVGLIRQTTSFKVAVSALDQLESGKLRSIISGGDTLDPSTQIQYTSAYGKAGEGIQIKWFDFLGASSRETTASKLIAWKLEPNGSVTAVDDQQKLSDAQAFTYNVAPNEYLILKGNVDPKIVESFKTDTPLSSKIQAFEAAGARVFLSRVGEPIIGRKL